MYTEEMMKRLLGWEQEILAGNRFRAELPPVMLKLNAENRDGGYNIRCRCGEVIRAEFGDFSKPLDNKVFKCPGSTDDDQHGVLASAINLILN